MGLPTDVGLYLSPTFGDPPRSMSRDERYARDLLRVITLDLSRGWMSPAQVDGLLEDEARRGSLTRDEAYRMRREIEFMAGPRYGSSFPAYKSERVPTAAPVAPAAPPPATKTRPARATSRFAVLDLGGRP